MTTKNPLVRINVDDLDKIAELYGIGREKARKIVTYRKRHGFFRGPDDLAKVAGVSEQLAATLAPHIDWVIPGGKRPRRRSWLSFILCLAFLLSFLDFGRQGLLPPIVNSFSDTTPLWWSIVRSTFQLMLFLELVIGLIVFMVLTLTREQAAANRFIRFLFGLMAVFLVTGTGSGVVEFAYATLYLGYSWDAQMTQIFALVICQGILIVPTVIALRWPRLRYREKFIRYYDLGVAVAGAVGVLITVLSPEKTTPGLSVIMGFVGSIWLVIGLEVVRRNISFFQALILPLLDEPDRVRSSTWLSWLNARLPDRDNQTQLKQALDEAYPRSRFRTFLAVVVIGSGGWFVVQAISAAIQWAIGRGLDQMFPK